jgi:hypothetical protein
VPCKNIAIYETTVGLKGKIIFKTYNKKKRPTKWGIKLLVLADSDTGNVHSIIPYYRKLTGDVTCHTLKNGSLKEQFFP